MPEQYLNKLQKAETLSDLQKIAKEIYSQICRETLIDGETKTMAKIYTLATIVLKEFMFREW